ncbi:MAG TPA: flagellar hook-basal body complex protein, partial [Ramlibacter sp.]|nr:flagellar hook-basal body complex protein [Ramlibacter sp.]
DGTTSVGTSRIVFVDGEPSVATATASFTYTPAGGVAQALSLNFADDVTSFSSGNLSTLAMASQDGYAPGNISGLSFDAKGALQVAYTNGQTVQGSRLLLGRFTSPDAAQALGGNRFAPADGAAWESGVAGEGGFGKVSAGAIENSNVDLSREFGDLVVMQRGYQASSQVISSANDMLQELFRMKSK